VDAMAAAVEARRRGEQGVDVAPVVSTRDDGRALDRGALDRERGGVEDVRLPGDLLHRYAVALVQGREARKPAVEDDLGRGPPATARRPDGHRSRTHSSMPPSMWKSVTTRRVLVDSRRPTTSGRVTFGSGVTTRS